MLYNASVFEESNLHLALTSTITEITLHIAKFSKQGTIPLARAISELNSFRAQNKKLYLQLDSPIFNDDLEQTASALAPFIERSVSLRLEDVGLARFLVKRYPSLSWHLLLPYHSKTLDAWLEWAEYFKHSLKRLVVSPEIPYLALQEQKKLLQKKFPEIQLEILAAGRLLLFYSSREILKDSGYFELLSLERSQRLPLKLFSNDRSFCIYHAQDLFLLDLKQELVASNVDVLRLDLYTKNQWESLNGCQLNDDWHLTLKKKWGQGTSYGFFRKNRSDLPFRLLKNKHLRPFKAKAIGSVIEYVKNSHTLIKLEEPLNLPLTIKIITPDGFQLMQKIDTAEELFSRQKTTTLTAGYYIIAPIKRAVPKSIILREDNR